MITTRTVCFVCFIVHLGTSLKDTINTSANMITETTETTETIRATAINNVTAIKPTTSTQQKLDSKQESFCTKPSSESPKDNCIFFLPKENTVLVLVLVALTVACFALLLITLVCACQVCHLKIMISRFQHHHRGVDLHAVRKRSESLCKDDGREKGQPTETCLMLSEVTVREDGNKEESVQLSTETPVEGLNGDVTQEEGNGCEVEIKEPDVGALEKSDTVV